MATILARRRRPTPRSARSRSLLRAKGETPAELAALVRTMLRFAEPVPIDPEGAAGPLVDTCGTGGDRSHTFNISTVAALVIAGAGVRVAKHGNRAASSACGSADLLEELGVVIDLGPDGCRALHRRGGHRVLLRAEVPRRDALRRARSARSSASPPRSTSSVRSPTRPGSPARSSGCRTRRWRTGSIGTLQALGAKHAMVFFGHDGLDELTTTDLSTVRELRDGEVHRSVLDPLDLGIARATAEDLRGGRSGRQRHDRPARARRREGRGARRRPPQCAAALVVADVCARLRRRLRSRFGRDRLRPGVGRRSTNSSRSARRRRSGGRVG